MADRDCTTARELDDPRPWEEPGAVRRDVEPHRGPLLRGLGNLALLLCILTVCWCVGLVGVPLAAAVWAVARHDLRAMAAGRMDPEGRRDTTQARRLGGAGVVTAATFFTLWVALYALLRLTK